MAEMNRSGRGLDPGIEKLLSGGRGHEKPSAGGNASAERDKRAVKFSLVCANPELDATVVDDRGVFD